MRNVYNILDKSERKRSLGRPTRGWETNVKTRIQKVGSEVLNISGSNPVTGSCEHGKELWNFMEGSEILDSAPYSWFGEYEGTPHLTDIKMYLLNDDRIAYRSVLFVTLTSLESFTLRQINNDTQKEPPRIRHRGHRNEISDSLLLPNLP